MVALGIYESEYYSKSRAKRELEKKVYINDSGIRNVAIGALNEYLLSDVTELRKVVEAVVTGHCRRLKFALNLTSGIQTFY